MVRTSNPRLMARVLDAIAHLGDGKGSSPRDILGLIRTKSGAPPRNLTTQVYRALKHAVDAGLLRYRSGRYRTLVALKPVNRKLDANNCVTDDGTSDSRATKGATQDRSRRSRSRRRRRKSRRRRRSAKRRADSYKGGRRQRERKEQTPEQKARKMRRARRKGETEAYDEKERRRETAARKRCEGDPNAKENLRLGSKFSDVSIVSDYESPRRGQRTKHNCFERTGSSRATRQSRERRKRSTRRSVSRQRSQQRQSQERRVPLNDGRNDAMEYNDGPDESVRNGHPLEEEIGTRELKNNASDSSI